MIHSLRGALVEKDDDFCLLDVQGVGYGLHIPASTRERLPEIGEETRLLTYLQVREDALTLFGFATPQERAAFEILISTSGVGARLALALLSRLSVARLAGAIVSGDTTALSAVPGIGKKTAERLILELKSKIARLAGVDPETGGAMADAAPPPASGAQEEAVSALVALGATQNEARRRVAEAVRVEGESAPVEALVSTAMRGGRREEREETV